MTIHPSPFVHCSSIEFDDAVESAKTTFAGGGTLLWRRANGCKSVQRFEGQPHRCGASVLFNQLGATDTVIYPLRFKPSENRLIVTATIGDSTMIGEEIQRVNGVSVRSVFGGGLALVSQEGDAALPAFGCRRKLWNDIAPFAIGVDVSDSIVEYASGDSEQLPVLNNEDPSNAGTLLRTKRPQYFGMNEE